MNAIDGHIVYKAAYLSWVGDFDGLDQGFVKGMVTGLGGCWKTSEERPKEVHQESLSQRELSKITQNMKRKKTLANMTTIKNI